MPAATTPATAAADPHKKFRRDRSVGSKTGGIEFDEDESGMKMPPFEAAALKCVDGATGVHVMFDGNGSGAPALCSAKGGCVVQVSCCPMPCGGRVPAAGCPESAQPREC